MKHVFLLFVLCSLSACASKAPRNEDGSEKNFFQKAAWVTGKSLQGAGRSITNKKSITCVQVDSKTTNCSED